MEQAELTLHYNCAEEGDLFNVCKCGYLTPDDKLFGQHVREGYEKLLAAAEAELDGAA